jgi:hypothetical protein
MQFPDSSVVNLGLETPFGMVLAWLLKPDNVQNKILNQVNYHLILYIPARCCHVLFKAGKNDFRGLALNRLSRAYILDEISPLFL